VLLRQAEGDMAQIDREVTRSHERPRGGLFASKPSTAARHAMSHDLRSNSCTLPCTREETLGTPTGKIAINRNKIFSFHILHPAQATFYNAAM
jgi:hypothetical protein